MEQPRESKSRGASAYLPFASVLSLLPFLVLAVRPVLLFDVRPVDGGPPILCSEIADGETILYQSVNSIFQVPVEEQWQAGANGKLTIVEVVSTPAVMGYYGIERYAPMDSGRVRATPASLHMTEIRMLVGPRGQQTLVVAGRAVPVYELVPEETTLLISVHQAPRMLACR